MGEHCNGNENPEKHNTIKELNIKQIIYKDIMYISTYLYNVLHAYYLLLYYTCCYCYQKSIQVVPLLLKATTCYPPQCLCICVCECMN